MDKLDYGALVDEAMHLIVYKALKIVEKDGLSNNHHFFISFITAAKGVKLSKGLHNKYPHEMTIVLQYQFENLKVDKRGFSIKLSFSGNSEEIYIPFSSITTFADPSVQFGLQFSASIEGEEGYYDQEHDLDIELDENLDLESLLLDEISKKDELKKSEKNTGSKSKDPSSKKGKPAKADNVVSLDKFRKKDD